MRDILYFVAIVQITVELLEKNEAWLACDEAVLIRD